MTNNSSKGSSAVRAAQAGVLVMAVAAPAFAGAATVQESFEAGAGFTGTNFPLAAFIKAIATVVTMGLAAWVIIAEFRSWAADNSDGFSLGSTLIRAGILTGIVGIVLTAIAP